MIQLFICNTLQLSHYDFVKCKQKNWFCLSLKEKTFKISETTQKMFNKHQFHHKYCDAIFLNIILDSNRGEIRTHWRIRWPFFLLLGSGNFEIKCHKLLKGHSLALTDSRRLYDELSYLLVLDILRKHKIAFHFLEQLYLISTRPRSIFR